MNTQITWTAVDGTATILTDTAAGFTVLGDGTRGLRSVAYELATRKYAGLDGEDVQNVRAVGGQPTLGLLIEADDEATFRQRVRALRRAMRPKAGAGVLAVSQDGETRELTCYCVGGFEGDESPDVSMPGHWWRLALKFFAPSPWWEGEAVSVSLGLQAPSAFFPAPPFTLSPSAVQGSFQIDLSDSDAPAYPVWTISGPGSAVVLTNETTGRDIEVNTSLGASDVLIIDTRPGHQSVRRNDGTNLMSAVASDPALWPLVEAVNTVSVALVGATSSSRVSTTYRPRYAGI
jgi:hypothetical protein